MKDSESAKRKPRLLPGLGGKPLTAPDDTSLLLKRLQEIAIELRGLKKLHPLWEWDGLDKKPEHVLRIGKLTHDRIEVIKQLRQLGVSKEDAEEHERKALEPKLRDAMPRRVQRTKKRLLKGRREKDLVEVLRLNLKGMAYCKALEEKKVPPPPPWIEEGCPTRYTEAYKIPKYRKRIQDEKHRFSKYLPARKSSLVQLVRDEKIFAS